MWAVPPPDTPENQDAKLLAKRESVSPNLSTKRSIYDTQTLMMNIGQPCWATALRMILEKVSPPEFTNLNPTLPLHKKLYDQN